MGRKPVVSADELERARSMVTKGVTVREAAVRLKIGKTALYEALRAEMTSRPLKSAALSGHKREPGEDHPTR